MFEQTFSPTMPQTPIKVVIAGPEGDRRRALVQQLDQLGVTAQGVDRDEALLRTLTGPARPDAVVLCGAIAGHCGLDLLRQVRSRSDVPTILAPCNQTAELQRVLALELGADDHVDGAVSACELLARVRAVLRRARQPRQSGAVRDNRRYAFGSWLFDQGRRRLRGSAGQDRPLTKGESDLLGAFVTAPGRVLSREHLLAATRRHEDVFDRSIDVQVLRLRRKLYDNHRLQA